MSRHSIRYWRASHQDSMQWNVQYEDRYGRQCSCARCIFVNIRICAYFMCVHVFATRFWSQRFHVDAHLTLDDFNLFTTPSIHGKFLWLGAFQSIVQSKLQIAVYAILCIAENSISAEAFRNDDIITLYSGRFFSSY